MMQSMQASRWPLKVEVARAETIAVEAIRVAEKEIQLAEVNHLVIRVKISLGRSSKWWCKCNNNKAVARRATDSMMVTRLWREPGTRHTIMHLHQGWDLRH